MPKLRDTADDKVGFWEVLMASIVDEHLPVKKIRFRPQDVPYMSHEWKNAIRAKLRTARKYGKDQQGKTGKINVSLEMRQLDLDEKQLENNGKLRSADSPSSFNLSQAISIVHSCPL